MGNNQSSAIVSRTGGALDTFVSELGPDIIYDKSLGSSRFLKTVRCRHRNGFLVAKIYVKPDNNQLDEKYMRRLKKEKKALQDVQNVYTYQIFTESDKAGYLVRQWVASNLYDRISTRPFLTTIEKKWIAFQILTGLRDARKKKVSHGDVKSENILVTSWNWVYITDFSSFKPTYLPLDNPSDFAYFYDTSGRRNCYIAPERFYTTEKMPDALKRSQAIDDSTSTRVESSKKEGKVTESMDVFSAGCVLAELFLEGTPLFTLSQLFKYRQGDFDFDQHLSPIEEDTIKDLIKRMVAIDPTIRPTFDSLLHTSRGNIFPECFYTVIHDFISTVDDISASTPFFCTSNTSGGGVTPGQSLQARPTLSTMSDEKTSIGEESRDELNPLPNDSDRRIMRIWAEFDVVEPCFPPSDDMQTTAVKVDYAVQYSSFKPIQSILPVVTCMSDQHTRSLPISSSPTNDGPALIILSLICANLRNCRLPSSKLRALDMLLVISTYLTDEAKLDRLLPYVVDLGHDEAPIVRMAALRTSLQILAIVKAISPFNADIFPQYILPYLRYMTTDIELSVRSVSAQGIVPFTSLAVKYLEMGQTMRAQGHFKSSEGGQHFGESQFEISYDARLEELQDLIENQLSLLLVDQSNVVKRSVLLDIAPLCIFFGRQKTNDVLLSHMITYLNDRDWLLRYAFFDSIVDVAACLGGRNLEEYIFPLMTQALSVLSTLTTLSELGLFHKMRLWELMSSTLPLMYHPNSWIRQGGIGASLFIASAAKALPTTDVWCILYPSLKHFLRSEIRTVDVQSILKALKSPLPRHIYDFALDWAMKMGNSQFWKTPRKSSTKLDNPKEAAIAAARKSARGAIRITLKSEEDEIHLGKLEQLGMSALEEAKLVALRDYIAKSADAVNSLRSRQRTVIESETLQTTGTVELQKLGVVPQTVFLGSRVSQSEATYRFSVSDRYSLSRVSSNDPAGGGAPFEDLRRRLATINGSNTSLNSAGRERPMPLRLPSAVQELPPSVPMRPGSPTESVVSTTNSVSIRPRFSIGSVEGVKAAPAVGSVRTNAMGLLEAPGRTMVEVERDQSGLTSPTSFGNMARGSRSPVPLISEDGQDTAVNTFLEHVYSDMNREAQVDFGPRVHEGPVRRRNTTRQSFTARDSNRRNVEATLIAHLNSHSDAVNGIAVSPDHLFFVSCSDDKTVKVWDTARLERNVTSKPRHTYGQHHARVKCVCILEGHHAFASAADDGSLHVIRVHVHQGSSMPKYTKLQVVREYRVERPSEYIQCMMHYNSDSLSNLIFATNRSSIVLMDLSTMRTLLTMENPRHHGPIVSFCLDRKRTWLVAAALSGMLSLWDLRFGLLLRTWSVGTSIGNGRPVRIRQCVLHPSKGRGRWIMVALDGVEALQDQPGTVLIEVWDVEKAVLVEWFISANASSANAASELAPSLTKPVEAVIAESSPAAAIASLVRARQNGEPSPAMPFGDTTGQQIANQVSNEPSRTVTSMVAGVDFGGYTGSTRSFVDLSMDVERTGRSGSKLGFLVVGSEDCSVKLLDLERFDRSVVLSERDEDQDRMSFSSVSKDGVTLYVETPSSNSPPHAGAGQRASLIMSHQSNLLRAHQDCVRAVACLDAPFRGGILTGDRAGVIKVWRVEGVAESGGTSYG
ncbi:uncharacterized protein FOMMEDRAFT_123012 [Fomitiporia mediterranea MF3/22]|uniref:uncharacterized protein n=1 Tax=Fomitiporia mediterranea (strain MF3/22) TaxID=694068 RepID=UPI00044072EE|nr:uncharacterized protein FOMMEDRAFT_123012 [Fomitiporia mediterranea MF3/22]EJD02926.1 hypothetical protein FOMMEDRAFT_123012 [Fomitiporia mediterranea MF3/22]